MNFTLISPQAVALIQTGAIVLGHVVGVVAAHDRAMEVFTEEFKTKAQYSLIVFAHGGHSGSVIELAVILIPLLAIVLISAISRRRRRG